MRRTRAGLLVLSALAVAALALGLRLRAVERLPGDYDEPVYLAAAQRYAQWLNEGDVRSIVDYGFNYEHPPLTKLAYAVAIRHLPSEPLLPEVAVFSRLPPPGTMPAEQFHAARTAAAVISTLETLALALFNPLAGLFLAVSTWQIKYTSQVMLEPLPALMSALTVLLYARGTQWNRWEADKRMNWLLALSGVAFGLMVAGKYTYGVAGLAVLAHWAGSVVREEKRPGRTWIDRGWPPAAWLLIAIVTFVAANPRLWTDPAGRLAESLLYHGGYAQSNTVTEANLPSWQPLVYLFQAVPWHPGVFLAGIDALITLLAVAGFRRTWERERVFALWLAVGLGFLLVWPTKWPQYLLTITVPWTVAAARGVQVAVVEPAQRAWAKWRTGKRRALLPAGHNTGLERRNRMADLRRAAPWLLPGVIALGVIAVFPLVYQVAMALTDFNVGSIKDGMNGGVWRAVWQGLTGQEPVQPIDLNQVFGGRFRPRQVHYAGPGLFLGLFGGAADIVVFNVLWTGLSVGLQALLGIAIALVVNRPGVKFARFWRTLFILPWAIPEFIVALIWMRIFEPRYGWIATATDLPAYITNFQWRQDPDWTLAILLIAATWYGFPLIMLAATAGLKALPPEVYDAAAMDGATWWTRLRYVTWPLLLPLVTPVLIMRAIFAFNQFYLFYTMQTPGNVLTLSTLSFYIFEPLGSFGGQFAVSAALNIFTVLILIGLIVWFDRKRTASEGVTYV